MGIAARIDQDLKEALLAGNKQRVEALRVIKSALQYEAVNLGAQQQGLSDEESQKVLAREAKKRQEAADLYKNSGETERAQKEEYEAELIKEYLPEMVSEDEISQAVAAEIAKLESPSSQDLGKIIGSVRSKLGAGADGGMIARIAKEKLS